MVEDGYLEFEGMRGNTDQRMCPVCRQDEGWRRILNVKEQKLGEVN
jgi:hypothetical protein